MLDGSLFQQFCKGAGCLVQSLVTIRSAHDDAARVEVVVECLALAQEFGSEDDVLAARLLADAFGVAYRNGALDDHDGIGIHLHHQADDFFYVRGVEVVFHRIIVGWCSNHYEVGILIGFFSIGCGFEVEFLFSQIFLYVFVLDRRAARVDELHLFGYHVYGHHLMMLAQQGSDAQAYISCSGYGDFYLFILHFFLFF